MNHNHVSVVAALLIMPSVVYSVVMGSKIGYSEALLNSLQITLGLIAAIFAVGIMVFIFKWVKNFRRINRF